MAYKLKVKLNIDNGEGASYLLKLVIHIQLYSCTQISVIRSWLYPFEIEVSPYFSIVSVLENGKLHFHRTLLFISILFFATLSPAQLSSYKQHIQLTVSGQSIQAIALPPGQRWLQIQIRSAVLFYVQQSFLPFA